MNSLTHMVDAALSVEKVRVRSQVRQSHLTRNGRSDTDTDALVTKLQEVEAWVDGRVAKLIKTHPAYPWFSRVKGVGKENIGKVVAQVRVKPEKGTHTDAEGNEVEYDLPYAASISALWSFAGFAVIDGKSPRRTTGEKLPYNSQLRSMCWRLGSAIIKAGIRQECDHGHVFGGTDASSGKRRECCPLCKSTNFHIVATSHFTSYFLAHKEALVKRYTDENVTIVAAAKLPRTNGKRLETEFTITEGHIHNMALRKMIKLFLSCLWLEWRKAEKLPVTTPYAFGPLQHAPEHFITPEQMTDR